ncbi:MAG: zinc-dependent metalloprotease [Acidimicrobiia bacterium]
MSKVDWDTARATSKRFSGDYPLAGTYHERRFAMQAPDLVARASALVAEATGLSIPGSPTVGVISRHDWVVTNTRSFAHMLEPIERALAADASETEAAAAVEGPRESKPTLAGKAMGVQVGAVLGFMSKRVLGQYELVLPTDDDTVGDSVLFVGANVLSMERQHQFKPSSFRFWVALHECAHRAQFTGVPWMRGYFLSLVEELIAADGPEKGRMARIASELRSAKDQGEDPLGDKGILGLLASPKQREVIDRVQALMSLLEGHGHVVMDRVGEREIVDVKRMSRVLTARRNDPRTAAFLKLVGIEMKMRQYDDGAKFINEVERLASWDTLSMAWESAETLPTLDEIRDARLWLERMHS